MTTILYLSNIDRDAADFPILGFDNSERVQNETIVHKKVDVRALNGNVTDVSIASGATTKLAYSSEAGFPNTLSWGVGRYALDLEVSLGDASIEMSVAIRRVDKNGKIMGRLDGPSTIKLTTGFHSLNIIDEKGELDTPDVKTEDRIVVVISLKNTDSKGKKIQISYKSKSRLIVPFVTSFTQPDELMPEIETLVHVVRTAKFNSQKVAAIETLASYKDSKGISGLLEILRMWPVDPFIKERALDALMRAKGGPAKTAA